ncbi:MAG TPA: sulfoxide reductase heme-binding subunit YedZ [Gammaproteobacteria bacterium]|nr:sulfoxide reductase heme-binding subunit YedZ [Gammaproteobacteria bacterium]
MENPAADLFLHAPTRQRRKLRWPPPAAVQVRWVTRSKPWLFLFCLTPLLLTLWDVYSHQLAADPIKDLTLRSGRWGLRLLWATLAITPLCYITKLRSLVRVRRMLGLFAWFYACLHLGIYLVLDQGLAWQFIGADISKRPYIVVGATTFTILSSLALTSTQGWVRRLGGKNWQRLHRLVYVAGITTSLHFFWLVKSDITRPMVYTLVLASLFLARILHHNARRQR